MRRTSHRSSTSDPSCGICGIQEVPDRAGKVYWGSIVHKPRVSLDGVQTYVPCFEKIYSISSDVKSLTNDCNLELEDEMEDPDFRLPSTSRTKSVTIEFRKILLSALK
ncbi:hypothetical protein AVEN_85042-1 [Araneus ventricosus]|uniref:Uncharacterized protein n=1 Tax=Araneus ventricosus TaxID=182803 RepID=A0A4Y2MXG7_ARAVE|nr:hypothetical protein AVEN_85042-1 [Araneus ventricosus]